VVALDVEDYSQVGRMFHPVTVYDGVNIPAGPESFDIVFSSNVLEHVKQLDALLQESKRVLRPDGIAVHILPSAAWRLWTIATHYPWLLSMGVERILSSKVLQSDGASPGPRVARKRNPVRFLRMVLGLAPHGEYSSSLAELYHYSRPVWRGIFERNGFRVVAEADNGLFYTGNDLVSAKVGVPARRKLATVLGTSCSVFILSRA
jgi:SAM-dependent methyltransferase